MVDIYGQFNNIKYWDHQSLYEQGSEFDTVINKFSPLKKKEGVSKIGLLSIGFIWCKGTHEEKVDAFIEFIKT